MATVLAAVCSLALFGTRLISGEIARGSGVFATGLIFIAVGGVLYTLRGWLPSPFLTWTLANAFVIIGPLIYIDACCVMTRQRRWLWPLAISAVLVTVVVYRIGSDSNNVSLRTFFTLGARSVCFAIACFLLLRVRDTDTLTPRRVLAGVFAFSALFNGQRAITGLAGIGVTEAGVLNPAPLQVVMAIGWGVSPVLIALAVITLVVRQATTAATQAALIDTLTGLASRRALASTVPPRVVEWKSSLPPREVAVMMVDLDGFKAVNDLHGHGVGDAALVRVAQLAGRHFADGIVLRYGGDELCAIVPVASHEAARTLAETFRAEVATAPLLVDAVRVPLTVSVGVAFAATATTLDTALRASDAALIAAKRGGRNRVLMAEA